VTCHTAFENPVLPLHAEFANFVVSGYDGNTKVPYSADSETRRLLDNPPPEREADVLRAAVDLLRERLPTSWTLDATIEPARRDPSIDAELKLRAPDGGEITILVEAKRLLNTRDVPVALEQLQRYAAGLGEDDAVLVLAARYLAPTTRERITAAGAGYVDLTGNMQLAADRPALLVRDRGADRDPWRGPGRPRGTLKGPPAARVVRALVDFAPPYSVPELAERAGASTGATYRVVEFLEEQDLVERERRGPITAARWRPILERWSRDYGFGQSNTVATFLEPRGLETLTARLVRAGELDYVLTGSLAAERIAAYAPARLAMLYVRDIAAAGTLLELRPTTSGANVALASSNYDVVFERAQVVDGLRLAALSQVAVDLRTGPGRNPSEAGALLDWMESNEPVWRR
jgi:hypothetical protein